MAGQCVSWQLILLCSIFVTCFGICHISTDDNVIVAKCTCSHNSFPADIPPSVVILAISNCVVPVLRRSHLAPFTVLRALDMRYMNLKKVEIDTFDSNLELQNLTIGNNILKVTMLTNVLCRMAMKNRKLYHIKLTFSHIGPGDWPDILHCLERMNLVFLDISHNPIGELVDLTFSRMTSLETLIIGDINHKFPINTRIFINLSKLKTLSLYKNRLTYVPNFNNMFTNLTMLPKLTLLDLSNNRIRYLPKEPVGLENLELLDLDNNNIQRITDTEMSTLAPHLDKLNLNRNKGLRLIQSNFSSGLRGLHLEHCDITFIPRLKQNIFMNMINIEMLFLSGNRFYRSDKGKGAPGTLLQDMVNLKRLALNACKLRTIYEHTFNGLKHLEFLSLSSNRLSSLSPELFKHLFALNTLYLDDNKLSQLPENVLRSLSPTLAVMNMGQNPFVCNCNLLCFMKVFRGSTIKFVDKEKKTVYVCNNLHNIPLSTFNMTDADCVHVPIWVRLTSSLCSSLVVLIILGVVLYRYRWHIGYVYFLVRAKHREARESQDDTQYVYDAFVVYNGTDVGWVKDELLPAMEEEAEFTLCVHDRDWLLGRDIVENIVQSIESSRKTLLVVSNAFAISQWCQLELTLAQHRLLEDDRNALILVLIETLKRENITPRLSLQMKRQTYMKWTEDPVGQALFWKKLHRALQKPAGSIIHESAIHTRSVDTNN